MALTDPTFIRTLETLSLLAKKVLGGELKADRASRRKGAGTSFADYAEYSFGDDYRNIDWNVYARFESLVVKMFEVEEDARVHIMLDTSRSMSADKFLYARQLAAAIGYIALNNSDHLAIYGIDERLSPILASSHGRGKIMPMLRILENIIADGGQSDFNDGAAKFPLMVKRRGICVVISDFLFPNGFKNGLDRLAYAGHDIFCIQIQDPAELSCQLKGDIELECAETGARRRLTVTPARAAEFAATVEAWNSGIKTTCAKMGAGLAVADISIPFETIVRQILRRGGLVA